MKKVSNKAILIAAILFVTVVGLAVFIQQYENSVSNSNASHISTPEPLFSYDISSLESNTTCVNGLINNVSQGAELRANITFTSMASQSIEIPIESMKLLGYSNSNDNSNWDTSKWNTSVPQEKVFSYSFNLKALTLQPGTSNSTILTLDLSKDAPVGRYALDVNLGNVKVMTPEGRPKSSCSTSIWMGLVVT